MHKILVIDDNDEFRVVLKEFLEREGYEVYEASNGCEGIAVYRKEKPELVITDIVMPCKEGLETMIELKKEFPNVKVIAMSGGGFEDPNDYLEGAKLLGGAARTFTKPFEMSAMMSAIKEILNP
ncbi:MAG: response regulator [Candidatus Omnitrophica bacterium]|nr:response regulator [Candidatus Omnitrophota bacterium]MDD4013158.1 response regulator [Candidatus Omnitrophota bacterium]